MLLNLFISILAHSNDQSEPIDFSQTVRDILVLVGNIRLSVGDYFWQLNDGNYSVALVLDSFTWTSPTLALGWGRGGVKGIPQCQVDTHKMKGHSSCHGK